MLGFVIELGQYLTNLVGDYRKKKKKFFSVLHWSRFAFKRWIPLFQLLQYFYTSYWNQTFHRWALLLGMIANVLSTQHWKPDNERWTWRTLNAVQGFHKHDVQSEGMHLTSVFLSLCFKMPCISQDILKVNYIMPFKGNNEIVMG